MPFDLSASRRDRVSAEAAFNLEIGVASIHKLRFITV
jgi:hypothetical protein